MEIILLNSILILVSTFLALTEEMPTRHVSTGKMRRYPPNSQSEQVEAKTNSASSIGTGTAKGYRKPSVAPAGSNTEAKYVIYTNDVILQPDFELTVNPFLSHIEQASWRLKRLEQRKKEHEHEHEHRRTKKQLGLKDNLDLEDDNPEWNFWNEDEDDTEDVDQVDPSKPHFLESEESFDSNGNEDDGKAYGDEEKDFRELVGVLVSHDYNY